VKILAFLLLLISCSSAFKGAPREGKTSYAYVDESGTYKLQRETKVIRKKIVTRSQILDSKGSTSRVLEKAIMVSQIGSIGAKGKRLLTVRPTASEFVVWLEGKKYSSKMQLDAKNKSMRVTLESPEPKWQGTSSIPFPKGKYFCFYNQIPECLYQNYLLVKATENQNQKFDFYVIWDNYPFVQDQLAKIGNNLFATASIKFDGEIKSHFRYIVEIGGQMLLYQFTRSFDLVKVAWIAQGITIAPPGEEIVEDE
jgi:hypothetical protein